MFSFIKQTLESVEVRMGHHLGHTIDLVDGLVQIPCIERNFIASVTAVINARVALHGDGRDQVSLGKVIQRVWETGAFMKVSYKKISRGVPAVNVVGC